MANASGSPNVSHDDAQEGCDKSEHEKSTHGDGFPGSVEDEDELPKDSDGGFHGSVDSMESLARTAFQDGGMELLESWACISFSTNIKETLKFINKLAVIWRGMGLGFYPMAATLKHVKPSSPEDVENSLWHLHDEISEFFSTYGKELGLLFVILPNKRAGDEIYGKCEEVCEKLGIVYHCCSPQDARNPSELYLKTTACEIIHKYVRRDAVHNFVMPFSAKEDDPTIVIGADIYRDSNICATSVASTFDWPVSSRYNCIIAEQPYKEVTIRNLYDESKVRESMVRGSLHLFSKKKRILPSRIIFFRSSVDEGQLSFILSQEIDAIQKACTSMYKRVLPITYVVVGRAESAAVDEDSPTKFGFSCCHQFVGGTTTVDYRVLHDDNKYDAHKLQCLCIKLCTDRVRWAQPELSMIPPAYYAHIAAREAHAHFAESRAHAHVHDGD